MQEPVLIYVPKLTVRFDYIIKVIFKDILGIPFMFSESEHKYANHNGPKLRYDGTDTGKGLYISPHGLLMEQDVHAQSISISTWNNMPIFFQGASNFFPFDVFAASFFLLTRYEEYLPYTLDNYNRFPHTQSIAFQNNFLHVPVINFWCEQLFLLLKEHYPSIKANKPSYQHIRTYDIDMAFCYKHKGVLRQIGAISKELSQGYFAGLKQRISILTNKQADPFDTFDLIKKAHQFCTDSTIFFYLVGKHGKWDKNINILKPAMQQIIKQSAKYASVALHPSYASNTDTQLIATEKQALQRVVNKTITVSRQHYIKFSLPTTFEALLLNGIHQDYSMGYGSINGFRASICTPHKWFNLQRNCITPLSIIPFCWMDANSNYEQNLSAEQAYKEYMHYQETCQYFQGTFVSIWHNSSLGNTKPWEEWQSFYNNTFSK